MAEANNIASLKEILSNIIQTYFKTIKDIAHLIGIEAKFAAKNLLPIFILSMLFQSFLMMSWICLCGLLLIYFMSLGWSILYSLFIVTIINFLSMIVIGLSLLTLKRNVAFAATRRQLFPVPNNKDLSNEYSTGENSES